MADLEANGNTSSGGAEPPNEYQAPPNPEEEYETDYEHKSSRLSEDTLGDANEEN
jgi:hypothetical protein